MSKFPLIPPGGGKEIKTISIKTAGDSGHPQLKIVGYKTNNEAFVNFDAYYALNGTSNPTRICGIQIQYYGGPWRITNNSGQTIRILSGVSGAPLDIPNGQLVIPVDQTYNLNLLIER